MIEEINTSPPDSEVVEFIESLLKQAKAGEIQSIAIATSHPNYCTGNAWAGMNKNNVAMIGEIEMLKVDLVRYFADLRVRYLEE